MRILHDGDDDHDHEEVNHTYVILLKIGFLVIILGVTLLFGYFPLFWKRCRNSTKFLGIANAFSGGIFMGIALFHLLPESNENFEGYFKKMAPESAFKDLPNAYFIAFLCYSLVLFVEKVAFNSHALIEHDHGDGHGHNHGHEELHGHDSKKETLAPKKVAAAPQELSSDRDRDDGEDSEDEDENTIKNVVSSRGKFASFLQQRNILKSGGSMIGKPDKAMLKASHILSRKNEVDEMNSLLVAPNKIDIEGGDKGHDHKESHVAEEFVPKSNITPYLLLAALSFHGLFEGIALGLQGGYRDTLFLFIAIISHKWAEAFTLGISFSKAQTDKVTFVRLILLFSFFTPVGIVIGSFVAGSSQLVEAIFLALSTGTFLYVAASEVIVEEFAVTKYKYSKFICYLLGGIMIAGLAVIEHMGEGGHSH
jgi:zinc transporter 1/2/3